MKLERGMLIQTNYSGPYRIKAVRRGCACQTYVNELNGIPEPNREPHIHLTCTRPDGKGGDFYLPALNEETLLTLDKSYCGHKTELGHDWVTVLPNDSEVQMTLF